MRHQEVSIRGLEDAFESLRHSSEVSMEPDEVLAELGSRVIEIRTHLASAGVDCAAIDRKLTTNAWMILPALRNSLIISNHRKFLADRGVPVHDCWWLKKRFWVVVEGQYLERKLALSKLALEKGA